MLRTVKKHYLPAAVSKVCCPVTMWRFDGKQGGRADCIHAMGGCKDFILKAYGWLVIVLFD